MPTTWNALYLGNSGTAIDPTEGNATSENASAFVGQTFGAAGDPLFNHIVSVSAIDNGGEPGVLDTNNATSNDQLQYDLGDGSGSQTSVYDGIGAFNATLTYKDGTTATITAVVIQDDLGNLFLAPELSANADSDAMEAKAIESLTLNSLATNDGNLGQDRFLTDFVCFAAGVMIRTPDGERAVEELREGDWVETLDHGAQPVIWSRSSKVIASNRGAPVRINAGALGEGLPTRDVLVSRQHRILVASRIAERMFGAPEVLTPAIRLVGLAGIDLLPTDGFITYCQLLLPRHELIFANGAPAETLLPGPFALKAMDPASRSDIERRCPDALANARPEDAARPIPKGARQRRLVERHLRNGSPLLQLWPGRGEAATAPLPTSPPTFFKPETIAVQRSSFYD